MLQLLVAPFNDEHIIPNWILRRFEMHSLQINLPHGNKAKYGSYTVPCCQECNSQLSEVFEKPLSNLFKLGYDGLATELIKKENNTLFELIYRWVTLIYFKTHLNDLLIPVEKDRRLKKGHIGDYHDWPNKHHLYCMSRVHYTNAIVNKKAYGSLLIMPAIEEAGDGFDYLDSTAGHTVMIQIGDICIIAVLNDANACRWFLGGHLERITGPMTPYQLKELFAHCTFLNMNLKRRPKFTSGLTPRGYEIKGSAPRKFELRTDIEVTQPELLWFYIKQSFPEIPNRDTILQEVREGKRAYLFNGEGKFIQHSV